MSVNGEGSQGDPVLLVGEIAVATACKAQLVVHVEWQSSNVLVTGTLICTNYRLQFVPNPTSLEKASIIDGVSVFVSDSRSVPIGCVKEVNIVSNNKRKSLNPNATMPRKISEIEVVCKDMKKLNFSLRHCSKSEAITITTALARHSQPSSIHLLFAFDHALVSRMEPHSSSGTGTGSNSSSCSAYDSSTATFLNPRDWEKEMHRLNVTSDQWRVTECNKRFVVCKTLGPFLVSPANINDGMLEYVASLHQKQRLPVWCWSHPHTGISLTRASMPVIDDESEAPDPNFLYAIAMARNIEHQVESKRIEKLRVTKLCGSVEDVTHAYTKLHEFCAATPSAEVPSLEKRWYGALESSGWLSLVQSCLMLAKMAAHSLCWKNMCTMLLEDEGRDLSAIVSCLTQLMVDPHFRSISGFEVLIQKEWVALGHPFTTRNALVFDTSSLDSEEGGIVAPVFLLFLDCVWQLSRQFPSAFEFSESYLLHLHDLQYSCLYSNFIFNCAKHRLQSSLQGRRSSYSISVLEEDSLEQGGEYEGPLLSAWGRWRATLSKEENEKCLNPFYYIFGSSDIHLDCRTTKSPTTFDTTHLNDVFSDTVPVIRTSDGLHPQNADTSLLKSSDDPRQFYQVGLLLPETSLCSIHIWSAFFFRHVPELRRINDQQLVKQDIENQFVREVRKLKDQLNELEASMGSFSSDLSSFIGEVIQVREQEMKEQTQANRKISLDTSAPFRRRLSAMLPDEIDFGFRKDATLFEKPISSRSKSPVFAQSSSLAEFQDVLYDRTPECQATPDTSPLQDRKSPIRQVYSSIGSPSAPGGTGRSPVVKTRLRVKMEKPLDPNMAIQWSTSSTVPHQAAAPRHSPIVIGRVLTRKESLDMEEAMSSSTQLTEL